ncbi:DUF695 domain-containing protein [Aureispira sp. CCB-E]|uniref:DUF695 domain-containing protein n=1 Tax=Aureispira sp. CCB-E TaxID=3051121 RepID=UPI002868E70C|nr:DUF695 domain-containing protein [Aureispira sp. CCB-E]WMX16985.1 DUF695 domain-containing protein [Aureispira sp. CCB-E]
MKMPENWDFYFEEDEDGPMSIFVNIGLHQIAPIKKYLNLLCISIRYTSKENGFPTSDDLDRLSILEEEIIPTLWKKFKAIQVGHITSKGTRDFFIYFKEKVQIDNILSGPFRSFPSSTYHFSEDKNWDLFLMVLMPSEEQYQLMQNRRVLRNMEKHGDTLQKLREVSHWAYFEKQEDQCSFEKAVKKDNFKVLRKRFNKEDKLRYEIVFSRLDKVDYDEVNIYTTSLYKLAKDFNGYYDGWECKSFTE